MSSSSRRQLQSGSPPPVVNSSATNTYSSPSPATPSAASAASTPSKSISIPAAAAATKPLDRDRNKLTEFGFRSSTGRSTAPATGFLERILQGLKGNNNENSIGSPIVSNNRHAGEEYLGENSIDGGMARMPGGPSTGSPAGSLTNSPAFHPSSSPPTAAALASAATFPSLLPTAVPVVPSLSKQYWMSDKNCSVCYDCGLPFHFWRRRHHW